VLEPQISQYKAQMDSIKLKNKEDYEVYNNLVAQYNSVIKIYNNKVDILKKAVADYNRQVNLYNQCAGG
jgi:hypothetical protein